MESLPFPLCVCSAPRAPQELEDDKVRQELQRVKQRLAQFPTTEAQDAKLLKGLQEGAAPRSWKKARGSSRAPERPRAARARSPRVALRVSLTAQGLPPEHARHLSSCSIPSRLLCFAQELAVRFRLVRKRALLHRLALLEDRLDELEGL